MHREVIDHCLNILLLSMIYLIMIYEYNTDGTWLALEQSVKVFQIIGCWKKIIYKSVKNYFLFWTTNVHIGNENWKALDA